MQPPSATTMPLRCSVEGPRGFGRVVVRGERPLALEAGEDAERANAFRNAAGQAPVDFAQPQHLRALDQAGVARGAGGADGVVRAR